MIEFNKKFKLKEQIVSGLFHLQQQQELLTVDVYTVLDCTCNHTLQWCHHVHDV